MIAIDSYRTLKLFFRTLASSHPEIKDFMMADDNRLLNRQISEGEYPLLLLDPPTVSTEIENMHYLYYHTRIAIVEKAEKADWQRQEEVLETLEAIMKACISYMENSQRVESMGDMEQIQMQTPDAVWGWQLQVTFRIESDFCYNGSQWLDTYVLQPKFVEDQTVLQIEVNSNTVSENWLTATATPPINEIATAINALSGVQATIETNDITGYYLIITAEVLATSLSINYELSGHNWNKLN